eukprot:9469413-Pyramimonas_sp.AAC.1
MRTRFYWDQLEPALIGQGGPRPRPRRVAFVDDDRLPPTSIERGRALRSLPEFPTLSSADVEQQTSRPTDARVKQKEKHNADKEAGIKPRKMPKIVEEGSDDCGDDLTGLGRSAHYTDAPLDSDTESEAEGTFIAMPAGLLAEFYADVFSITPTFAMEDTTRLACWNYVEEAEVYRSWDSAEVCPQGGTQTNAHLLTLETSMSRTQ